MKITTDIFIASSLLEAVKAGSISQAEMFTVVHILRDAAEGLAQVSFENGGRLAENRAEVLADVAHAIDKAIWGGCPTCHSRPSLGGSINLCGPCLLEGQQS